MPFILLFLFFLGVTSGSYTNSWVWRVENKRWKWGGRSVCVHCGRVLVWYENIPVVSFVVLWGQCRTCHSAIPASYPLVEFFSGLLFVCTGWYHFHVEAINPWPPSRDLVFVSVLLVIFVYDFKYQIIPTGLVWSGALFGLAINYSQLLLTPYSLVLGTLIGWLFFYTQYLVSHGRWIGGGDVRLGAMLGIWLGWPNILVALFFAYMLGALSAIPLLISGKKGMQSKVPFGTFLAMGALVALFFGVQIIQWYSKIVGW